METLILDDEEVNNNTPMPELIDAVESAFAAYENDNAQMPAKSYIDLPQYNGDFRSMPAYLDVGDWDAAGIKWVNVHPDNEEKHGLPTVMGTMIYSDPRNAFPLAIMDGTQLTMKRTGAAAAVATDHLALPDAHSLGIIGAGVQSYTQLLAIAAVRDIGEVIVHDVDEEAVKRFIDRFGAEFNVREGSISEAGHCDILSTVTPVESPIVNPEDIGEHTHINAMGADASGKHELANDILLDGKVIIDDYDQTTHSGEINVPYSQGILTDADIDGEIGEVVTNKISGRTETDTVTIFDSTGLAIQDVAAAHVVYEYAQANDIGTPINFVGV
ncbi:MAG: ornithine cyclodeaminase family protein [Halobacteriaceae archaeon]